MTDVFKIQILKHLNFYYTRHPCYNDYIIFYSQYKDFLNNKIERRTVFKNSLPSFEIITINKFYDYGIKVLRYNNQVEEKDTIMLTKRKLLQKEIDGNKYLKFIYSLPNALYKEGDAYENN